MWGGGGGCITHQTTEEQSSLDSHGSPRASVGARAEGDEEGGEEGTKVAAFTNDGAEDGASVGNKPSVDGAPLGNLVDSSVGDSLVSNLEGAQLGNSLGTVDGSLVGK